MWAWVAWLLERDMSTPTQAAELTADEIDQALTHWSNKLHTDPDPLSRWGHLKTCDAWLDARLAYMKNESQNPNK